MTGRPKGYSWHPKGAAHPRQGVTGKAMLLAVEKKMLLAVEWLVSLLMGLPAQQGHPLGEGFSFGSQLRQRQISVENITWTQPLSSAIQRRSCTLGRLKNDFQKMRGARF